MRSRVVRCDRNGNLTLLWAMPRFLLLAENVPPAGMADAEPFKENLLKERRQRDAASCPWPFDSFSFVDQDRLLLEVDIVWSAATRSLTKNAPPNLRRTWLRCMRNVSREFASTDPLPSAAK